MKVKVPQYFRAINLIQHPFSPRSTAFTYTISDGNGGTAEANVIVSVIEQSQPPPDTNKPTMRPTLAAVISCSDLCFEPLEPDECPSCDPVILPSCSDPSLELGALCESDGECESEQKRLFSCFYTKKRSLQEPSFVFQAVLMISSTIAREHLTFIVEFHASPVYADHEKERQ